MRYISKYTTILREPNYQSLTRLPAKAAFIGYICQGHIRRPHQFETPVEPLHRKEAPGSYAYIVEEKLLNISFGKSEFREWIIFNKRTAL